MRPLLFLGVIVLFLVKKHCAAPCGNCSAIDSEATPTDKDVEEDDVPVASHSSGNSNLAWLVTPALFALGVMYVIYKCCRDGLCNCKRLRRRAAEESTISATDHGYIPLSQVALFSSSQVPVTHPGVAGVSNRRLILVHNRTYCVTVDTVPGATGAASRRILVQPLKPPTYEEAVAQGGTTGDDPSIPAQPPLYTASEPPCYRIAMGEITPAPSLEDHLALESIVSAIENESNEVPFDFAVNRRRHRSAQDTHARRHGERHRHFSAQEARRFLPRFSFEDNATSDPAGAMRPRCFSFSALRDAFRRSHTDVHEREALLDQEEETVVSGSREALSSPGPSIVAPANGELTRTHSAAMKASRRANQQVSFEDRVIIEDSCESNESIANSSTNSAIGKQLRQRHYSAPESSKSLQTRLRHSSGNS